MWRMNVHRLLFAPTAVLVVLCCGCATWRSPLPNADFLLGDTPSFFNDPKNNDNMGKRLTAPVQQDPAAGGN